MTAMQLNNFQEVIILAATFYIAFVAVDYVKSFSTLLYEKVFRLPDFIKEQIAHLEKLSIDAESLKNFAIHEIDGKNLVGRVEQVRRTNEILLSEISNIKTSYTNLLKSACMSKNIQSVSLFMFITCLTALMINGMESTWSTFSHCTWIIYSVLSTIYLIATAIPMCSSKVASFERMCIFYVIIFILSIVGGLIAHNIQCDFPENLWLIWLPISIFMLWLCFLFIFITIYNQVRQTKRDLQKKVDSVLNEERYAQMNQLYQHLLIVGELASID